MSTVATREMTRWRNLRNVALALVLAVAAGGLATGPALADGWHGPERHEWRGDRGWGDHGWRHQAWRAHEWRERHYYRPYVYSRPAYVYAPPPVIYAPPVYAPPVYAPPSVSFVFPFGR